MSLDFVALSKVRVNQRLSEFASKGKLLNAYAQYDWIRDRQKLIGWTYNFNVFCSLVDHFDRLISCQGRPTTKIRVANNTHMKCYIDKKSMLITSFNLSFPTINDLGIEVSDIAMCNYMRRLFNKHWKELE